MFFSALAVGQDKAGWLNDRVTIRFQEEPMSTVLGKIAQQTGIAILYDEKLADQKVTGYYKDIKFSETINRLFSEKNKSIQVFKNEKKIIVKTFGAKQFILASSAETTQSEPSSDDSEKMTLAELEKIHRRQYKEYKKRISNEDEVFEGGMTRRELRAMQEKQQEALQERLENDHTIIEGRDVTLGELRALHDKQKRQLQASLEKQAGLFENGMTRGEITAMHRKQKKKLAATLKNDDYLVGDGINLGQLRRLHKAQSGIVVNNP